MKKTIITITFLGDSDHTRYAIEVKGAISPSTLIHSVFALTNAVTNILNKRQKLETGKPFMVINKPKR
ncbi:MAG: hypothetical protein E3J73_01720 [Candidatus Bathyarchaeum sp.]|nr:MAG: hypothetical protein E3J73_01720 [Candidatus Bathyarchaeum sp.]